MKYWFFDGNDVIGPFTPQELAARADFSVNASLVCPENFSEDGDSWKPAVSFADFGPDALSSGPAASAQTPAREGGDSSAEETALFDQEMDTFLKNPSILAGTAAPAPEGPGLEIPKKPAKPGPIEDYFNNINGEDLGDILGIPDANENSDMNLPRVVDGHFDSTTPPTDKSIDFVEGNLPDEEEFAEPAEQTSAQQADSALSSVSSVQPSLGPDSPQPQVQPAKHEDPIGSVPISVADEEELVVLPGEKEGPLESGPQPAPSSREQADTPSGEAPQEPLSSQEQPVSEPAPQEEEHLSTCTLPLVGERENMSSLPTVPEDGVPQVPPVQAAGADFEPQPGAPLEEPVSENLTTTVVSLEEAEALVSAAAQAAPAQEPAAQTPNAPAPVVEVEDVLQKDALSSSGPQEPELAEAAVEASLNQVKPKLSQTPEIEQFLTTQRRMIQRARQRKANVMLWVVLALLAAGIVFALLHFFSRPAEAPKPAPRVNAGKAAAKVPGPAVRAETPSAGTVRNAPAQTPVAVPPAPLTEADKALAAVQNHQLPGAKGTIASYFDRIYKTQLSQGYTGEWSAEALHKNTYIVKYRLSKTRVEPIVYVFQADAARGKLTGALNNIALDLVGKI